MTPRLSDTPAPPSAAASPPPRVSVIVPMHNAAPTLRRTADSVRAQTLVAWELILIDDASTDATLALAHEFSIADPRIRVLRLTKNQGAAAARNAGIDAARGHYLHFLDADDTISPNALELLAAAESTHSTGAAVGEFTIRAAAEELFRHRRTRTSLGLHEIVSDADLITHAHIVRRDRVGSLRFRTGTHGFEDTDFWLRLAESGVRWSCVPEAVAHYHIRPGSLTKEAPRMLADGLRVLDDLAHRSRAHESPLIRPHRVELAKRRMALLWATRAAVLPRGSSPIEACRLALSAGGSHVPARRAGECAVYQILQGLGLWPSPSNFEQWGTRLLAYWRELSERGALRSLPGAIDAFARAAVRQRDVAEAVLARLDQRPVTILGFGRNGRELAEHALRRGVSCVARDHRPIHAPPVLIEPIDAPLDPHRLVVVTPDADAGLLPFAGEHCVRWSQVRARLARGLADRLSAA